MVNYATFFIFEDCDWEVVNPVDNSGIPLHDPNRTALAKIVRVSGDCKLIPYDYETLQAFAWTVSSQIPSLLDV